MRLCVCTKPRCVLLLLLLLLPPLLLLLLLWFACRATRSVSLLTPGPLQRSSQACTCRHWSARWGSLLGGGGVTLTLGRGEGFAPSWERRG